MPDEFKRTHLAAALASPYDARKGRNGARRRGWNAFSLVRCGPPARAECCAKLAAFVAIGMIGANEPASAQPDIYSAPAAIWPYTDLGQPGEIVAMRSDAALGTTTVAFATGARLVVKPTRFSPGQVTVIACFGKGRSGVPDTLVHAVWATTLFPIGGTGKLSFVQLDQWQQTSGHAVNITFVPTVSAFQLKGEVASSELGTEMQLLTAFARDPGFRKDAVARIATVGPMIANQIEGDSASTFMRGVQHTLVGGRYQELPERSQIAATTGNELPEILGDALASRADVIIVGDVTVEEAIRTTAATFAAGPPRPVARHEEVTWPTPLPRAKPVVFEHKGESQGAWFGEYWPLPDLSRRPVIGRIAEVAAALLEARLKQALPPRWNGASPPIVRAAASPELRDQGQLGVALELLPNDIPAVRVRIEALVRNLAEGRVFAAELQQAKLTVSSAHKSDELSNAWWATRLSLILRNPRIRISDLQEGNVSSITAADVAGFLNRFVIGQAPITVISSAASDGVSGHR